MRNTILTDCDGVLLNWEYAFDCWVQERGHKRKRNDVYDICERYDITKSESRGLIKIFNECAAIGFLPPQRDAMHYVRRLHEEYGYVFRVITSLSTDPYAKKLRARNLEKLFGSAIEDVICLPTGADKDNALLPYKDSGLFWIEDKVENAIAGHSVGLNTILVEHEHNMHVDVDFPIAKNWREIFNIITGEVSE